MLLEFTVENYRSFLKKKTLVFTVHRPGIGSTYAGGLRRSGGFE